MKRIFVSSLLMISICSVGWSMNEKASPLKKPWLETLLMWLNIKTSTILLADTSKEAYFEKDTPSPTKKTVVVVGKKSSDSEDEQSEYEQLSVPEFVRTGALPINNSTGTPFELKKRFAQSYKEHAFSERYSSPITPCGSLPSSDDQLSPHSLSNSRFNRVNEDLDSYSRGHLQKLQRIEKERLQEPEKLAPIARAAQLSIRHQQKNRTKTLKKDTRKRKSPIQQEKEILEVSTNAYLLEKASSLRQEKEEYNARDVKGKKLLRLDDIIS